MNTFFKTWAISLIMLSNISYAQEIQVDKHTEILNTRFGMVHFLIQPAYPISMDNNAFISYIYNIKEIDAKTHTRQLTHRESLSFVKGINPHLDVIKSMPAEVVMEPEWRIKYAKQVRKYTYKTDKVNDIDRKYNIHPTDYPLMLYFAPSGNLYKIPTPAWRGQKNRQEFWNILKKEMHYHKTAINRLANGFYEYPPKEESDYTKAEVHEIARKHLNHNRKVADELRAEGYDVPDASLAIPREGQEDKRVLNQGLSEEDLNKKRLFTIK